MSARDLPAPLSRPGATPLCATLVVAGLTAFWPLAAEAQQLSPRAYWPAPEGTTVLTLGYEYSSGDTLTDPSLPITGLNSDIHYAQAGIIHTFDFFGRTANAQFALPATWGKARGFAFDEFRERTLAGVGDVRLRLAVNLLGAPTMNRAEFQALRANPRVQVGLSLAAVLPTGRYEEERLINVGTNRVSVKPAVGIIIPLAAKWLLEFEAGMWLFTDDDEFVFGRREQEPIFSSEVHLVRRFRPGLWVSLDGNFYGGGQSTVAGVVREDLQRNSRVGVTAVVPIAPRHFLRGSLSTGLVTRSGGDFRLFSLLYLFALR